MSTAVAWRMSLISSAVRSGSSVFIRLTAPETWGVAMDVPSRYLYPVTLLRDHTSSPGATTSSSGPQLEKLARSFTLLIAPTAIVSGQRAGNAML
jgi:hypothetical protein